MSHRRSSTSSPNGFRPDVSATHTRDIRRTIASDRRANERGRALLVAPARCESATIPGFDGLRDTFRYNALYAEHQQARLGSFARLHDRRFRTRRSRYDSTGWENVLGRCSTLPFAGGNVRVLSREGHLCAIAIYGLKHSFRNLFWLCDIAVSIEAAGDDFDWAHCVGNAHPQDQWLGCHIRPEAAPYVSPLPRWLVPTVFAMWNCSAEHGLDERWAVREFLENPASLGSIVARRWSDPVTESLRRNVTLSEHNHWQRRLHALQAPSSEKKRYGPSHKSSATWLRFTSLLSIRRRDDARRRAPRQDTKTRSMERA